MLTQLKMLQCDITYCQLRRIHSSVLRLGKSKKYSDTLCLPRTLFPARLEGNKRAQRDQEIYEKCNFSDQYNWQRKHRTGPEYVLHDGPPYANGNPHIGHAVNKILKDITIRYECGKGRKVHYITGWDCHGLPIELKAVKGGGKAKLSPPKIREIAAKFAEQSLEGQRAQFKRWGILTNWEDHYRTMNPDYVKTKLKRFHDIYRSGLIFREYMPVYWSPSSRTALAEAELEYNPSHVSKSVYLRFKLTKKSAKLKEKIAEISDSYNSDKSVYGLIWTTTPWSLVANQAVCYNDKEEYALLEQDGDFYLVASKLVAAPEIQKALPQASIKARLMGEELAGCAYVHPLSPEEDKPFLGAEHVTASSGTGLVHTAPAHGQDDFRIGLVHGLGSQCVVDENGRYAMELDHGLAGLSIMDAGTERILELLQPDILLQQDFVHSYPYDWRTKQPVFLRASKQWFLDTNRLKDKALEAVKQVQIQPASAVNGFRAVIQRRPYWCISRQRVWGTPIPVLYKIDTDEPVLTSELLDRYCELIDTEGTGFWWTMDIDQILQGTPLDPSQYRLGGDILDIWFDSGISWAAVLDRQADLYLEGLDQFSGWFYTSLLTGVALTGAAPYKQIFVHGFTLDENGNKMSKSLGNVVDPRDVVEGTKKKPAKGVDVLRWWVGLHASSSTSVLVGDSILAASQMEVNKIRNTLRFLLGMLSTFEPAEDSVEYSQLRLLDKILLHKLKHFQDKVDEHYAAKEYNKVCLALLGFLSQLSATHLHLSKDRLYCDGERSPSRLSGLTGLYLATQGLLGVLSPILPHLGEEAALEVSVLRSPVQQGWFTKEEWTNQKVHNSMELLEGIRDSINKQFSKPADTKLILKVKEETRQILEAVPLEEVAEVLGVLELHLQDSQNQDIVMEVIEDGSGPCDRCRRLSAPPGQTLCPRCLAVIADL